MKLSTSRSAMFLMIAFLVPASTLFGTSDASGSHDTGTVGSLEHGGHAGCPLAAEKTSGSQASGELPQQVGQDAFVALAEMKSLLDADPMTDWSRVDLDALREHLVDMNRVVLGAEVVSRSVPGGFEARVTGTGRTLEALRRMIPAHARFIDGHDDVKAVVTDLASTSKEGVMVTVTTNDPTRVARLRGLGFFGFLISGDHHRPHHMAMARGEGHP